MPDKSTVSETVARPVRTAIQMAPAYVFTDFVDAFIHNLSDKQYGALFGVLTIALAWGQTAIEDARGRGWWLRNVPPKHVNVTGG